MVEYNAKEGAPCLSSNVDISRITSFGLRSFLLLLYTDDEYIATPNSLREVNAAGMGPIGEHRFAEKLEAPCTMLTNDMIENMMSDYVFGIIIRSMVISFVASNEGGYSTLQMSRTDN